MDFHLLQTSLPVPTLWTCWIQQTNWDQDHGWHAYVIMTAVLLVAAFVRKAVVVSCWHDRAGHQPTQPSVRSIDTAANGPRASYAGPIASIFM